MGYGKLRFAVSLFISLATVSLIIFVVLSTQIAMAALPLMDAVGIGGLYLSADSFDGEEATVYPVQGTGVNGPNSPVDADTPVCRQRPMLAIQLQTANVQGFQARKDVQLPHLQDRWMTIEISQPFGGRINGNQITFYTTQLQVGTLDIRNIVIRSGRPGQFASQGPRVDPENQVISEASTDKFGPYSGEFYLEGGTGTSSGTKGLSAQNAEAWLHAVTGQSISFSNAYSSSGIELDVSFPTTQSVRNYYDTRLGFSGQETGQYSRANGYFDCVPVEVQ